MYGTGIPTFLAFGLNSNSALHCLNDPRKKSGELIKREPIRIRHRMLVQIQYHFYVLTFKITRSKLSFLGSSKKEILETLRYLLAWAKVSTKGLHSCIYAHGPRFEPRGQGENQVPTLQYLLVAVFTRVGKGSNQ